MLDRDVWCLIEDLARVERNYRNEFLIKAKDRVPCLLMRFISGEGIDDDRTCDRVKSLCDTLNENGVYPDQYIEYLSSYISEKSNFQSRDMLIESVSVMLKMATEELEEYL